MDLISVVVPVYNVEQYLLRCVDSIRSQTYSNLEIILVDDGSPDRCPQMCDELQQQDSRIQVIHKSNEGLGLTRNAGMKKATGKYITFVDSDDWISPDHIENLYKALTENQADVVMGNHTRAMNSGEMIPKKAALREGLYEKEAIFNEILLPLIGPDVHSTRDVEVNSSVAMNLYRMDVINEHNLQFISERYAVAEDVFFNMDYLFYAKRVVHTEEFGYYYFQNMGSLCEKYNPKRFERTINFYCLSQERIVKYQLQEQARYRVERSFLMKLRVAIRHIVLSDLPQKEKLYQIREVLSHDTVKTVLQMYPIDAYYPSMRILMRLMKAENVYGVFMLMWLREKGRGTMFTRSLLRKIGIGK